MRDRYKLNDYNKQLKAATQLGWYLYDQQTGFDYGMIVGTFSVIFVAWLMYEKNWREEDED